MPTVFYFFIAAGALILGYFTYSKVVEKAFGADFNRPTPAVAMAEGWTMWKCLAGKYF